jgi:hypothetical protein
MASSRTISVNRSESVAQEKNRKRTKVKVIKLMILVG